MGNLTNDATFFEDQERQAERGEVIVECELLEVHSIFSRPPEEITAVLIAYRGESEWYNREALSDLCAEWWVMEEDDTSQPPTRIESQITYLEDIESVFAIQGLRYD